MPSPGDQVLLGIMLIFHGHWGHAIRTGSLGAASAAAQGVFSMVEDMHTAMLAHLRPGADLRVVGDAGLTKDRSWSWRTFPIQGRPRARLQLRRPDRFRPNSRSPTIRRAKIPSEPRIVEPGMLFEVHPNLFVDGIAGASIGDMVLVTEHGPELLTKHPRTLLSL